MTEPTLYLNHGCGHVDACRFCVPVERCEHGNIDPHIIGDSIASKHGSVVVYYDWCPGAGVSDE